MMAELVALSDLVVAGAKVSGDAHAGEKSGTSVTNLSVAAVVSVVVAGGGGVVVVVIVTATKE